MQTKNLAVMFTDMKGFTARTSVGSRKQIEHLLELHENLLRPVFKLFRGQVIKTIGDAFLVVFESPTDAVLCGMRIQEAVADHNTTATSDERFEVRVAINSGEVHLKNNDVFGEPVNIAARIESIAEPNEVYFTESIYLTMNKNEIPSAEVGMRHLKGVPEHIKVYKVLREKTQLQRARTERGNLVGAVDVPIAANKSEDVVPSSSNDNTNEPKRSGDNKKIVIAILATLVVVAIFLIFIFVRALRADENPTRQRQVTPAKIEERVKDQVDQVKDRLQGENRPIDPEKDPQTGN